jgi:hypothetical protein
MHHTKNKGDLGVLKAQVDLFDLGSHISLRVETPKNGQKKNIRLASDYRRVP